VLSHHSDELVPITLTHIALLAVGYWMKVLPRR